MIDNRTNILASLLRSQFDTLSLVGAPLAMNEDRQRRMLLVPEGDWSGWSDFLRDGPLPSFPSAPTMLRRLAAANYRVASVAARHAITEQVPWAA